MELMTETTPSSGAGFLAPYRVLDLTDERGLLAGMMFARLGADVIQVEPPGGSPARRVPPFARDASAGDNSLYWFAYASGKRSVTCALDRVEGRSLLQRLVAAADVLFETEGAALHPELRFETLKQLNPRLVHVTITPFGSEGPKSQYADSELIVWAAAGPLEPNRDHHDTPYRISAPQAYLHAGADAASGALLALFARNRTGKGQHVDVSAQQASTLATMSSNLAAAVGHQNYSIDSPSLTIEPRMVGMRKQYNKWAVKDGFVQLFIGMGPADGRFSNQLFKVLRQKGSIPSGAGEWDWVELPRLLECGQVSEQQVKEARAAVAAYLASQTKRDILDIVLAERLPMSPGLTVAEVRDMPHYNSRGLFEIIEEGGKRRTIPGRLGLTSIPSHVPLKRAPRIGEHNNDVYADLLGLTPQEIFSMRKKGTI
jgi:crotonobetainyl-CoA:carnitine CoA-transferase CaiB-like acyl-CoA transferase